VPPSLPGFSPPDVAPLDPDFVLALPAVVAPGCELAAPAVVPGLVPGFDAGEVGLVEGLGCVPGSLAGGAGWLPGALLAFLAGSSCLVFADPACRGTPIRSVEG
jgi:hypothetical protein